VVNPVRFVTLVVTAQVLAQIGTFTLPALLPDFIMRWGLSGTEAGWLIGAYFLAYVAAVPVLVSLTDRVPARRIYMIGTAAAALSHLGFAFTDDFWLGMALRCLAGIGWAGCYMPGLKVIADRLEGAAQSRAVTWHAAGVGIAGACSFIVAGGMAALGGVPAAFLFSAAAAFAALLIGCFVMPRDAPPRRTDTAALLDFRPVLRNRQAMAWIAGYTVHTWELAALRAWGVAFLVAVIALHGAPAWLPGPTAIFTIVGLVGIATSIAGNELAQRLGRARVVAVAMGGGAVLALACGLSAAALPLAVLCIIAWNAAIYLDSSALTAGTVQAAETGRRGATMGLHSMCGYAGGFIGPIGVGVALDAGGGWALAFGHLAMLGVVGLLAVRWLGRRR
jgi:MFS family permease